MASLFMNPAECGPVNDLKSLGGRLDVDGRARRDGFVPNDQYGVTGPSRQALQPFQALPQSSGFSISSPSSTSRAQQQRPIPTPQHAIQAPPPPPSFFLPGQGQVQYPLYDYAPPQGSTSFNPNLRSDSVAWAKSFSQSRSQVPPQGTSNGWADEHLRLQQAHGTSFPAQSLATSPHQGSGLAYQQPQSQFEPSGYARMQPSGSAWGYLPAHQRFPDPMDAQTYHHQAHSGMPEQTLRAQAQQQGQGQGEHIEQTTANPFGTPEFLELMKDLALDQGETMRTKNGLEEGEIEGRDRVDTEGRGSCFFGGFDDNDAQTQAEEAEGIPHGPKFDLSRAVPTVHQPVFDQEGRWVPYDRVKEFRENGMDVPRHLKEALDLARISNADGLGDSVEREARVREEVYVDDGFDNDGLMEFYGQTRRSRDPFAANHNHTPTARERQRELEHVERMRTGGYTSRETREAWMESEDALDKVLGDEKQEEARRQGYYQDKRRGVGAGMDGKYLFISENPYVLEGGRMEEMISLGEAAGPMELQYQNLLEHEARVLQDPSSSRAWFDLAIKQQELERDDQAIRALLQCISLDPDCKEAYLALSVSYTNEGMIREGHSVLERWVEGSSGSRLDENKGDDADLGRFDVGPGPHKNQRHEVLTRELMRMARMMPEGDIDADVQVALGVLFNASEEYEKAQDCFRAALFARQDDWMLYNRLGATLANGGKSEEALQYYEQALSLNPGYVRAMFNVGISLVKLARYRQAARYILDAIRLQHADASSNVKSMKSVTSDILWNTLGTTCMHLERHDLMDACAARDLDVLDQEFQEYE